MSDFENALKHKRRRLAIEKSFSDRMRSAQNEWETCMIVAAAFLPLTLPNLWAGKWRHSLFQLALWLAIMGCRRWSVLLLIPFYLATPILVFVCQHYGPPDLDLLASVRGSSSFSEKLAFLEIIPTSYYWLYSLMLIPVLAYLVLCKFPPHRTPAGVRWVCLLIVAGFLSSWCIHSHRLSRHGDTMLAGVIRHIGWYQPLGLPVSLMLAALDVDGEHQAALQRDKFKFDASSRERIDNIVFVIGESSRADHWHINGYPRPTTPELERIPDLISFSNVMSLAPNTVLSWPFLFTPKVAGDSGHWPTQKSFISAFKEAGYNTYFVSFYLDQNSTRNDPLAIIAFESDTVVNGLASAGKKSTDVAMLPAIRQILADPAPKLVVVSTQGSHEGFEVKLPLEYGVFQPSVLTGTRTPEGWRNGYDDSIRMTDDFLASIIGQLQGSRSVLFYVSDHGLACYDKGENKLGQIFIKPEYRPACVVWASQEFLEGAEARSRFDFGRQHAATRITSDYVFHSFLDLCGIQTRILNSSKSLFDSNLIPPVKYQVEDFHGHWLDYDRVPDSIN